MKMTQEEMKRYFLNESRDVSIAIENFVIDDSTTENTLAKAKSSAKKLIEKIDEYLETLKPKIKVGDYVVEQNGNVISKIEEVGNGRFRGSYYKRIDNRFYSFGSIIFPKDIERYATTEEVAEYKAALNFHERGREPFEIKDGDLIESKSGTKTIITSQTFSKMNFVNGNWKLLKTAEEIDEWLGADDE